MEACDKLESAMEAQNKHGQARTGPIGSAGDPTTTVLTYLTFLEKKLGYLRGMVLSAPRQIVSAELGCIAAQLVSISNSLIAATAEHHEDGAAKSPPATAREADSEDSSNHDLFHSGIRGGDHDADYDGRRAPSYEVIQLDEEEILAPHVHTCAVCGKGFKRDANLRMHMRGHGDEYKTAAALAKPSSSSPSSSTRLRRFYSCPYAGCKRNRDHANFQPLKTAVCVKNHYRRSHCDKGHVCRRCGVKRFSVLADLRTHEKHCGRDRWTCTCGTSFSRKDKLFGHVAAFDGHAPALPPPEEDDDDDSAATNGNGGGSTDQLSMDNRETVVGRVRSTECYCSSDNLFGDFNCSDVKGFPLTDGRCLLDDGQAGFPSTSMAIDDSCYFDAGLDLFGASGFEFGDPNLMGF